jgi:FAD/FMN-containing dehydrogenase
MSFLATGGRHGYSTSLGAFKGGLGIDLSQLNSISIDKAAKTLTIGPGVRFRDIFNPVYEAGFQIRSSLPSLSSPSRDAWLTRFRIGVE